MGLSVYLTPYPKVPYTTLPSQPNGPVASASYYPSNFSSNSFCHSQEKGNCFTYCPRYNSAIVLPVEPNAVKKKEHLNSVQKWRTPHGFVFPGKKTSIESNFHHKKPDSARLDELNKVRLNAEDLVGYGFLNTVTTSITLRFSS